MNVTRMAPILLVDMGNQRLKWCLYNTDDDWTPEAVAAAEGGAVTIGNGSDEKKPSESATNFARRLGDEFDRLQPPSRIFLSAVSDSEAQQCFVDYCTNHWQCEVIAVDSEVSTLGLENGYDTPSQLGCDRWLAALAGYRLISSDPQVAGVIVVDAGTAVTVDLVQGSRFMGGAILPGIATIIRTLGSTTGRIRIDIAGLTDSRQQRTGDTEDLFTQYGNPLATDSSAAVRAGALLSVCGGVDRCIDIMREKVSGNCPVLVTGGDSRLVAQGLRNTVSLVSNLVISGLALLARQRTEMVVAG